MLFPKILRAFKSPYFIEVLPKSLWLALSSALNKLVGDLEAKLVPPRD